jgi:hypothetical protein
MIDHVGMKGVPCPFSHLNPRADIPTISEPLAWSRSSDILMMPSVAPLYERVWEGLSTPAMLGTCICSWGVDVPCVEQGPAFETALTD